MTPLDMHGDSGSVPRVSMQRSAGQSVLAVSASSGTARIKELYQSGASKIRIPQHRRQQASLDAVLINTSGGMTGGDRYSTEIKASDRSSVLVTTQACEKVYKALADTALVTNKITVTGHSHVSWMPQETILFDRSSLTRTLDVDIEAGSSFLGVESYVFGRTSMGETLQSGYIEDRWRITYSGIMVHREDFILSGAIHEKLSRLARTNGAVAISTILFIGTDAEFLSASCSEFLEPDQAALLGSSCVEISGIGKILARVVAPDSYTLRKTLIPLLNRLSGENGVPKIWSL